jgi:hypothetical protein
MLDVPMLRRLHSATARFALVAALLLFGTGGSGALAAPTSAAEAGVNLNNLNPSSVGRATALGAHWIRVFESWRNLEPSAGVRSAPLLAQLDGLLASLPPGTHVILDLVGAPAWESGSGASNAPPRDPADYASLLHFLAARWAGRVAAYEIWNEEDAPLWWAGGPDPAAYTRLLQASYTAVKTADPNAAVVLGGLTGNDYDFLQGVYEAGGKGYFDAVGVHTDTACNISSPYEFQRDQNGRLFQNSFLAYREVHATELANNDEKPIWMTEMSWRTTSATCSEGAWAGQKAGGVSDAEQATFLSEAYHCLAGDPYVQLALWYPLVDEGAVTSGLLRSNFTHKPAYAAMRSYIQHGDQLTGTCGDFSGPQITTMRPSNGQRYSGHLFIRVKAADSQGIRRIRLFYDGHLIRNFVPYFATHTYPASSTAEMTWYGARYLPLGRHQITIVAIDKLENSSSAHLVIVHVGQHHKRRHHRQHH